MRCFKCAVLSAKHATSRGANVAPTAMLTSKRSRRSPSRTADDSMSLSALQTSVSYGAPEGHVSQ